MTKRSYKQEFLDLEFTFINDCGAIKVQCALSYKVLSNESLKKNKLKRHLATKHPEHMKKKPNFSEHREAAPKRSLFDSAANRALLTSKQATLALYEVALCIVKKIKPHTIGEQVDKSAPSIRLDSSAATPLPRNCDAFRC